MSENNSNKLKLPGKFLSHMGKLLNNHKAKNVSKGGWKKNLKGEKNTVEGPYMYASREDRGRQRSFSFTAYSSLQTEEQYCK